MGEEMGERGVVKAEGKVVVEKQGGGGEVGRAEEDEGIVDDDDLAVHEAAAFDGLALDGGRKGKRAGFGVDEDGDGDATKGFLMELFDDLGIGDGIDGDVDGGMGGFNGAQES